MNSIDVLVLAVVAVGAFSGWYRGLVTLALGLAGTFVSFYLAAKFSGSLAQWLETKFHAVSSTAELLARTIAVPTVANQFSLAAVSGADLLRQLDSLQFPAQVKGYLVGLARQALQAPGSAAPATLPDLLFRALAMAIWTAVSFFAITFLTSWIIRLVSATLSYVTNRGPTGPLNRVGGAALGALEAALGLAVLAGLAAPLLSLAAGPAVGKALQGSRYLPYLLRWFQALYSWAT